LLCVVYVAVCAKSLSLVQRSPTVFMSVCLSVCDLETSTTGRSRSELGCFATERNKGQTVYIKKSGTCDMH